jgi:AraC-like DNA-binding protein
MKTDTSDAGSATIDTIAATPARKLDSVPAEVAGDLSRLGFLSQLCLAASSVERALHAACRFSALWTSCDFSLSPERDRVSVSARLAAREPSVHGSESAQELLLLWLRLAQRVAGVPIAPESLRAPSESCAALQALFDCPIKASSDQVALYLHGVDMRRENPAADERLFRVLVQHAEERLLDQLHTQSVSERLSRALLQLDDSADSRAEALAARLGLGVRTLHRRLRAEGTSYRKVLTSFQMRRCIERLASPSASAKQVAFALGFSDPASFYRAFKRWTGHTVSEYRMLRGSYHERPSSSSAQTHER